MADSEEVNKQEPQSVDLNDLTLVGEQMDVNTEVDAFAGPPPPDDGEHLVKLSLGKRGVQRKVSKAGKKYLVASLVGKVIDPAGKFDGRLIFDDLNASTLIQQNGSCGAVGILKQLGETVAARVLDTDVMRSLVERLAGEPQLVAVTNWEAYCTACEKRLRGQRAFKENPDGTHQAQIVCPTKDCGNLLTAQARVSRYKPAPTT